MVTLEKLVSEMKTGTVNDVEAGLTIAVGVAALVDLDPVLDELCIDLPNINLGLAAGISVPGVLNVGVGAGAVVDL